MKIRNGFVSNSSSSSFIATYGKVVDNELFEQWKSTISNIKEYQIMSGSKLVEEQNDSKWCKPVNGGFDDIGIDVDKVINEAIKHPNQTFIFKDGCGLDGDSAFRDPDDDDWECNYDIELETFDGVDIELYNSSPKNNGVKVISQTFYAGRNG